MLAERKARRERDDALLAYVERHSRFFAMLTLVAGGLTGVAIWFTIALVHPPATATLIAAFVWGWAIEWTFFATEIAAALVYAYGWRRLPAATHVRVGWVYCGAAWLSLGVINGILSFMLTPGAWLSTHGFWDGVLNPTYLSSLVVRTAGAVGLAGVYALMTASWMAPRGLKERLARYAGFGWVLPAAIALPFGFAWFIAAAGAGGVPVAEIFGAANASLPALARAVFTAPISGHPIAQHAAVALMAASLLLVIVTLVIATAWRATYGVVSAAVVMLCVFTMLGAAEFIREDLRKPFVIGGYMFVNGVRLGSVAAGGGRAAVADRFAVESLAQRGILESTPWTHRLGDTGDQTMTAISRGGEVFRLSCAVCHTIDGYLAVRPLVRGMSPAAATSLITRLATPQDAQGGTVAPTCGRVPRWGSACLQRFSRSCC